MHTIWVCSRGMASSSNPPPPAERASELINKLPSSPGLITKTGTVVLGTGLLATAISQELYVVNEETVIAAGFFILLTFIAKVRESNARSFPCYGINSVPLYIARASGSPTVTGRRAIFSVSRVFLSSLVQSTRKL